MTRSVSRNRFFVTRWGALCMGQERGLEARFQAVLVPGAKRDSPKRSASYFAFGVALAATVSLSAFQLRVASADVRAAATSAVATLESHFVTPSGDDAVLPDGVTVHAIGASEVSANGDSDAHLSDRVWWHPNGTLYASPPQIGYDQNVKDRLMYIPPHLRRLRFAVRIDKLPKQQDTGLGPMSNNRFAGSSRATTTRIPGGLVWLIYCSVPNDAREESLSVSVSHGPWKGTLRRPLVWSPVSRMQSWKDLRSEVLSRSPGKAPHVHGASDAYAEPQVYPIASAQPGSSEFGVRLARRDVTDGKGNDWRFFLLDKDEHRLTSRNLQESSLKSDFLVKFSTDEKTARRAAFVGVESRPFTYVTFKHLAVKSKGTIQ